MRLHREGLNTGVEYMRLNREGPSTSRKAGEKDG